MNRNTETLHAYIYNANEKTISHAEIEGHLSLGSYAFSPRVQDRWFGVLYEPEYEDPHGNRIYVPQEDMPIVSFERTKSADNSGDISGYYYVLDEKEHSLDEVRDLISAYIEKSLVESSLNVKKLENDLNRSRHIKNFIEDSLKDIKGCTEISEQEEEEDKDL